MSQHDYILDNQDGASFRADINSALAAIATVNSGPTAPTTTFAAMLWQDTTTGVLKQRNAANTAWLEVYPIPAASILPAKLAQPLTLGTSQASTSGTVLDFTGIPSWAKRVTVMLSGVSTNGASDLVLRLGSGSVATSGYASGAWSNNTLDDVSTASIILATNTTSAMIFHGIVSVINVTANTWVSSFSLGQSVAGVSQAHVGGGSITLAGALDRIRITTAGGTDTFDAGAVNILYE